MLSYELKVLKIITYSSQMGENLVLDLYKRKTTVFTLTDISFFYPKLSYPNLKSKVNYYVNTGKLQRVRKGIYAKENFNPLELGNKLYTPSYISLETVLQKEGVIFQHYTTIFIASYLSRKVRVADHDFFYRKIKNEILLNHEGIEQKEGYFIATKERAFLDAVFLYKDYHFDNLKGFDWEKINAMKKIYQSQSLEKRVEEYYQIYQNDHAGQNQT